MKDQRIQELIDKKDWDNLFSRAYLPGLYGVDKAAEYNWDVDMLRYFAFNEKYTRRIAGSEISPFLAGFHINAMKRGIVYDKKLLEQYLTVCAMHGNPWGMFGRAPKEVAQMRSNPKNGTVYLYGLGNETLLDVDISLIKGMAPDFTNTDTVVFFPDEMFTPKNAKVFQEWLDATSSYDSGKMVYRLRILPKGDLRVLCNVSSDPKIICPFAEQTGRIGEVMSDIPQGKYEQLFIDMKMNFDSVPRSVFDYYKINNTKMSDKFFQALLVGRISTIFGAVVCALSLDQVREAKRFINEYAVIRYHGLDNAVTALGSLGKPGSKIAVEGLWATGFFTEDEIMRHAQYFDPGMEEKASLKGTLFYVSESTWGILRKTHGRRTKYPERLRNFNTIVKGLVTSGAPIDDKKLRYLYEKTGVTPIEAYQTLKEEIKTEYPESTILKIIKILKQY